MPWSPTPLRPIWPGRRATFIWCRANPRKPYASSAWSWRSEPNMTAPALALCWRLSPTSMLYCETPYRRRRLLTRVFWISSSPERRPPLRPKSGPNWCNCASPSRLPLAFLYIRYLVGQHEVEQARLVWLQAATLCGLAAYQPSAGQSRHQRRFQPERVEWRIRLAVSPVEGSFPGPRPHPVAQWTSITADHF